MFFLEFVCFGDVSLDAILSHPRANLDPFLPNLGGYLVRILANLPPVWTNLGQLGPTCTQLWATYKHFESTWANLIPTRSNLGPPWTNLLQLGSNFGQLWCKIGYLGSTMALYYTILDQNKPLETWKIIVFVWEFVCFRDVSIDAIFDQLRVNLGELLPNLEGYLVRMWTNLASIWTSLGLTWANLHPTLGSSTSCCTNLNNFGTNSG